MSRVTIIGALAVETNNFITATAAARKAKRRRHASYGFVLADGSRVRWAHIEHFRKFGFEASQVPA